MRTRQLALATVLATAGLAVQAGPRMEATTGPFTYEAVGATPTLTFGRTPEARTADAPKAADTKTAATTKAPAPAARANASAAFTYEPLGATPHVELKKQPAKSEVRSQSAGH